MLQRIGDALKGQKWLAYLVLGALAVVFAAWGAYGVVNLSFGGSNYAAEANGSKISLEEAREAWLRQQTQWQQRLGGAEIPAPLRGKLQDQVLEGLIGRALLTQRTHDMGYRVSQDALREAVHSEQAFQVGGQYSPEAAKAALAQAGISLQAYEQDLRTQAKAGKDFGDLAKQYSQDPGSAKNGGDLGWAERSSFVAPFADALFGMHVGEIKGPVKTQFGYHIIRLDEIQAGKSKSFEEARADLEAQLRRDRATDRFGEVQEQLQSRVAEPGADLGSLAQQYNLLTGEVASFVKGAGGPPVGAAPALQELRFADPPLAVGRLGGPVLLGDDRLVIVKVLEHRKPQPRPLAEVHEGIVTTLTRERGTQAALKAAEGARAKLEGGLSFEALAQELKVSADPAHFVGRHDPSIPAPVRDAVFAAPHPAGKPLYRALALTDGGAAVVAVMAVRTATARDPKTLGARALQEAERRATDAATAYVEEMRRTADVRKNPKAFE